MKCDRCGKGEAIVRIVRILPSHDIESKWYCEECAAEASPYQKKLLQKPSLDALLKEMIKQQQAQSGAQSVRFAGVEPCPTCGLEFAAYRSTYMLGCPDCYEAFAEQIEEDLKKLHRAVRHTGEESAETRRLASMQETLRELREDLRQAIDGEEYERAARLRDEIARLEKKLRETPAEEDAQTGAAPGEAAGETAGD